MSSLLARLQLAHAATLGGLFMLLGLLVVWHGILAPSIALPPLWLPLLMALPLLLILPGLLRVKPRSHLWTALLMIPFLVHGILELTTHQGHGRLAILEIGFSLTCLVGASFAARWQRQWQATVAESAPASSLTGETSTRS